ncbi:hypothetical protein [Streptomyces sp. AV19]|nr:hypothetical protein [Streptomyces sp. AV19]MDG4533156.1 hypothetical protein [Streptomyces sp. AV19]
MKAIQREAEGVYAVAAAEVVVLEAANRDLEAKAKELERRPGR